MIRLPPRSTPLYSSAASDVYKRQPPWVSSARTRHSRPSPSRPCSWSRTATSRWASATRWPASAPASRSRTSASCWRVCCQEASTDDGRDNPEKGVTMKLERHARRLTVFVGEADAYGHKPLATEIVHRAQQAGLAGATVLRGIEGFGASNHVHTTRILSLSNDLPIVIVTVS